MKKNYMKPTSKVYEVVLQNVIADSVVKSESPARSTVECESDERGSWGSLW
jgi:hypothetical protein